MKKALLILLLAGATQNLWSQTYSTKKGYIRFFSSTLVKDIKADNNEVVNSLNSSTGELLFTASIKAFSFENKTMQKHFNDPAYMDSDLHPTASFKGTITNLKAINFKANGTYPAFVSGDLTIKGVTKKITTTCTITVNNGAISSNAVFKVQREDFGINPSGMAITKIAKEIEVTVQNTYESVQ
ncbi:YceI family protein [Polluticaenibacter yanchengensis]|uniref:YceI family protein n=1 Tax=Polluticaenibacter yanchengensis TaxID=3014562 RepID=A0ABT4UJ76_9BACT|nr:YceI family protein [Chitinophagaceae bacterium LY-5]